MNLINEELSEKKPDVRNSYYMITFIKYAKVIYGVNWKGGQ